MTKRAYFLLGLLVAVIAFATVVHSAEPPKFVEEYDQQIKGDKWQHFATEFNEELRVYLKRGSLGYDKKRDLVVAQVLVDGRRSKNPSYQERPIMEQHYVLYCSYHVAVIEKAIAYDRTMKPLEWAEFTTPRQMIFQSGTALQYLCDQALANTTTI